MNSKTFRIGGIHPEENKLTHEVATQVAPLPKQAIFPLSQHIGAPAKPVVQKGDKVKVGTLLAEAGGSRRRGYGRCLFPNKRQTLSSSPQQGRVCDHQCCGV